MGHWYGFGKDMFIHICETHGLVSMKQLKSNYPSISDASFSNDNLSVESNNFILGQYTNIEVFQSRRLY